MNVFEDLIVELKEENLLEKSVLEIDRQPGNDFETLDASILSDKFESEFESNSANPNPGDYNEDFEIVEVEGYNQIPDETGTEEFETEVATEISVDNTPPPRLPRNGQEFYTKRAMGEVSNLQMVEHVLTGVEREYMKIAPNVFDDFSAKKALNAFLKVTNDENSTEHKEAELNLMHETEAWCTSLSVRDRNVPVSSLRQYCERSSPALSSQALVALARFYRNLPYTESIRSKFDFVITRLFSRPDEKDSRRCLFTREETLTHLNTLYKDWSSIALYSAEDDDSNELLTALSFEDMAIEAENASSFDQLIQSDFFGRIRNFKSSISELFYAPTVTAAVIDANVRIGNKYVTLIGLERGKMDAESVQNKYGDLYDDSVSTGVARTLDLCDLLRERPVDESDDAEIRVAPISESQTETPESTKVETTSILSQFRAIKDRWSVARVLSSFTFSVNKPLLVISIFLIGSSLALYMYSTFFLNERITSSEVKVVNVEKSGLEVHIKTARVSGDMFYGLLLPSWDTLPKEKRQEFLQKVLQAGNENGYTQVNLISKNGKTVGFASATRLEVIMQ